MLQTSLMHSSFHTPAPSNEHSPNASSCSCNLTQITPGNKVQSPSGKGIRISHYFYLYENLRQNDEWPMGQVDLGGCDVQDVPGAMGPFYARPHYVFKVRFYRKWNTMSYTCHNVFENRQIFLENFNKCTLCNNNLMQNSTIPIMLWKW